MLIVDDCGLVSVHRSFTPANHPKLDIISPKKTYTLVFSNSAAGKHDRWTWKVAMEEVKAAHS